MSNAQSLAKAVQLYQAGKLAEAEQICRALVNQVPDHGIAWYQLGKILFDQNQWDEAVSAFKNSLRHDANAVVVHSFLGESFRQLCQLDQAIIHFDQALQLAPNHLLANQGKAKTLFWQGQLDLARSYFEKSVSLNPDHPATRAAYGTILLLHGEYERGWQEYAWRWKITQHQRPVIASLQWKGESLDQKTILLIAEQGLGDTIQFVRYAGYLKEKYDCKIVVSCQKALIPLLQTYEAIDELIDYKAPPAGYDLFTQMLEKMGVRSVDRHFDCYVYLMDIPGILSASTNDFPSSIPYLSADANLIKQWKNYLAAYSGVRIGLAWQGNPKHADDYLRRITLHDLLPLNQLSGVSLFSLQKGFGAEQVLSLRQQISIVEFPDEIDEKGGAFMDTAAILKNLDLLITTDTAIAHVAGALGVPVWLLLSQVPDWRWQLQGETTPWYPTMRLFRQTKLHDWHPVLKQIIQELQKQFGDLVR